MRPYYIFILGVLFTSATNGQPRTNFDENTGEFAIMLRHLETNLYADREMEGRVLGGKKRTIFVRWIRDHVHVMKAMKYLHPDMKSFLAFYLENQTGEGIYYDYFYPLGWGGGIRKTIFDPRYWREFPEDEIEMHRLPVEADLEYLMVEGVYAVYQSSGDLNFIRKWLPTLVKGMNYSMTDPLRWSKRHQLVKRGYTLDTWDFMQLPTSREEYTRNGGDVQKGIFNIDENTPMGIMHGDNSGMYDACRKLAVMFHAVGNTDQAKFWDIQASHFREKTNKLCWNGKFYAHFIEDDPQPSYLNMDQRNTLSLSNPYDINRGLPTESMAQSIIETYLSLKESNKQNSFAEWYGIYPAVEPHFADYKPGSYMNGGVNTIVAGELAKAAFQHGYEAYGVDILRRINKLIEKHNNTLPVAYTPEGVVDAGIPDNWGQAAVYSAMIEGLAGVVDQDALFRKLELSPRWLSAGINTASVRVVYGPSEVAINYTLTHNPSDRTISIVLNGAMDSSVIRVLLPPDVKSVGGVRVNRKTFPYRMENVRESTYVVLDSVPGNQVRVSVDYNKPSR
jgi:hypothetical protein